jgi:hypothetical protein
MLNLRANVEGLPKVEDIVCSVFQPERLPIIIESNRSRLTRPKRFRDFQRRET